jgi:hypothetical protein
VIQKMLENLTEENSVEGLIGQVGPRVGHIQV